MQRYKHTRINNVFSDILGPVAQSVVSLTNSLVFKMLTVLVSATLISQVLFAEKNVKATHIYSTKILAYMPFLMIKVLTIR